MKVYTTYTPSHKIMYDNYFLKTLPDEFDVHAYEIPQECDTGIFIQMVGIKHAIGK